MNTPHKNQNNRLGGGQTVSLISTIKRLIRAYPGGLGIVKELIQNADDAEARTVQITLDWRKHHIDDLPEQKMEEFLQPALLIFNDAAFKEKDFDAIQKIGEGSKQTDLTKAGRFGLGFNSVYHLTDYPSFASLDRIKFFDPHSTVFQKGGEGWLLEDPEIQSFLKLYESGLPQGYTLANSTVFRLPLRVEPQSNPPSISNTIFDRDAIQNFRDELLNISEEILLFLKSVDEIRVCEIVGREVCELMRVTTKNKQAVFAERQKLTSLLQSRASSSLSVSYLQEIETQNQEETFTSLWRVCNVIRSEEQEIKSGIALMAQCEEKAVPWAGVAAKIKNSQANVKAKSFEGKAYCFLPLNFATGLPVHVHGFFDLDEARTDLTRKTDLSDQKRNVRADWNLLLVKHVLSHAYANLIKSLVEDVGEQDPHRFYRFFPISSSNPTLKDLPKFVIEQLQSHRVMRSAIAHPAMNEGQRQVVDSHWVKPTAIKVLPEGWDNLLEPLRLEKIDLPDPPFPSQIESVFKDSGKPLATFQPSDLRSQLQTRHPLGMPLEQAPRACLRKKEWVIGLLKYCTYDGCCDVRRLPLAILADGILQTFGYSSSGFIYLVATEVEDVLMRKIFVNNLNWFLDLDFAFQTSANSKWEGVSILSPVEVVKRLQDLIKQTDDPIKWNPTGQDIPNAMWLSHVYSYLANLKDLPIDELIEVPLVPCNDGLLYRGGFADTPLWYNSNSSKGLLDALKYFKIPLIHAPKFLEREIEIFYNRHPNRIIFQLSVPDLIDTLHAKDSLPAYDLDFYAEIINFLNDRNWMQGQGKNDADHKQKLRELKIYLTSEDQITDLQEAYLPSGYTPPKVAGSLKLLRLGVTASNQEWKSFYNFLGVPTLDHAMMIQNLLKDYAKIQPAQQLESLEWIRDHLSIAQTELERGNQNFDLKKKVRETPLIRCADGHLRAANTIYNPKTYKQVQQVLGDCAHTPDMTIYENVEHWLDFFRELRMLVTPNSNDLLSYVDSQIHRSRNGVTTEISKHLTAIFNHIEEHWERLENDRVTSRKTLAEELSTRDWLPVERSPERLNRFPGFTIPQNRLFRSSEVCFSIYGSLVASQKPLLSVSNLPAKEFQKALGFTTYPDQQSVVAHFKTLIDLWSVNSGNGIDNDSFHKSIQNIYGYFHNIFCSTGSSGQKQQWLRDQLDGYECLWDNKKFWLPEHTFQKKVPFFGNRRQKILIEKSAIRQVYELLGQKASPDCNDYADFLQELALDCKGNSLTEDDAKCAYEVLQVLTRDLEIEQRSTSDYDLLLLTEDNLLLPPDQIIIPDAPWRIESVRDRNAVKILHPQVPPSLASALGSRSLSKDVNEVTKEINPSNDQEANKVCRKWQSLMRSPEFIMGLKRLILDQHGNVQVDLDWLSKVSVQAAAKISTNLMLDQLCIASGVEGSYYFEQHKLVFYLSQDSEDLMQDYLTESLNQNLQDLKLSDTKWLFMILNSKSSEIEKFLDRRKVKPLPPSLILQLPDVQESEEFDDIFGDDSLGDLENIEPEEAVTESINETTDIPKSDPPPSDTSAKSTVAKPIPINKNNPVPTPVPVSPIIKPAQPPASTTRPRSILDVKSPSQGNVENTAHTKTQRRGNR